MDIVSAERIEQLSYLGPGYSLGTHEVTHILKLCDALWLHSGDPKQPHAELTSGKCSNGFVNVLKMLRYSHLCDTVGYMLAKKLQRYCPFSEVQGRLAYNGWTVGSDHAGATISYSVAKCLRTQHDFTEKTPEGGQVWKRHSIEPGSLVLQVEELITTAKTLMAVRRAIRDAHDYPIEFCKYVLTIVDRSSGCEFEDSQILSLVKYNIETWDPADCPLCAAGSKRLRPKDKQHWAELTGK